MSLAEADLASADWYPSRLELVKRPYMDDGVAVDDDPFEVDQQFASHDISRSELMGRVHLPDVGMLGHTPHMEQAIERGRSTYYYHRGRPACDPLFDPPVLRLLSLDSKASVGVPAMTFEFGMSHRGIGDFSYYPSRVKPNGISYNSFNKLLDAGDPAFNRHLRVANLIFRNIFGETAPVAKSAEDISMAFSLFTNIFVRKTIDTDIHPLIKRNHLAGTYELVSGERKQRKAWYGVEALGHADYRGFNLARFTAGLRRSIDAVNASNAKEKPPFDEKMLAEIAAFATARELEIPVRIRHPKGHQPKLLAVRRSALKVSA